MRTSLRRGAVALAAVAVSAGVIGTSVTAASAAPGDPVTGGTTTLGVPTKNLLADAAAGVNFVVQSPASATYDKANKAVDVALPVDGGDGSVNADYGSIDHAGSIKVSDCKTHRSITLTDITFSLDSLQISATPSTGGDPIVLGDLTGSNTFASDGTGNQEFTSTAVTVDPAGAAYLNSALSTTAFKAGGFLATFDTKFVNTQY